ncbi:MAG: hypothetical protein VYB02_06110 [Actinomycetota bacterium]|nr:hypothetical protein [Actinomycetota bacterium]
MAAGVVVGGMVVGGMVVGIKAGVVVSGNSVLSSSLQPRVKPIKRAPIPIMTGTYSSTSLRLLFWRNLIAGRPLGEEELSSSMSSVSTSSSVI